MFRLILLLAVALTASAINLQLYPEQQKCFLVRGGDQYRIEYLIDGSNQQRTTFEIRQGTSRLHIFQNISQHFSNFNLPTGDISLCWTNTDSELQTLSVSFFLTKDPIRALITKHDVSLVEEALSTAIEDLNTVGRNQLYQYERDHVHRTLLEETDKSIVVMGVAKIVVMLGSVGLQVWVMRGFFKNTGVSYTSVATT